MFYGLPVVTVNFKKNPVILDYRKESSKDDGLKVILRNAVMINAYTEGIPGNGNSFPEDFIIVKIEWSKRKNPVLIDKRGVFADQYVYFSFNSSHL